MIQFFFFASQKFERDILTDLIAPHRRNENEIKEIAVIVCILWFIVMMVLFRIIAQVSVPRENMPSQIPLDTLN